MDLETRKHLHDLNEKLDTHFKSIHQDMATIKRGIYGDEANQVKGLLTRQNEDDQKFEGINQKFDGVNTRMGKLEKKQFKQGVFATAILVSIQLAWNTFKEFFK